MNPTRIIRYIVALSVAVACVAPVVYADDLPEVKLVAKDPEGHGLLATSQGKTILIVKGTPEQMGGAHGRLLKDKIPIVLQRVVYMIGAAECVQAGTWFFDTLDEIERRCGPHVPERFVVECDAMSKAAGFSVRDGRYANLFPERFHCSGFAVRDSASADGRVLHARVLDYMRDIGLQTGAVLGVFIPDGKNAWLTVGYGGFIGTVTAINEKGLAVGEMGGRGEGNWDGCPMTLLLRDIMERAETVDEAVKIFQETPRTCEYYYVVSDKNRNMVGLKCTPDEVLVLKPGEQNDLLPFVPEDTILMSAGDRAECLSKRLTKLHGKIGVQEMIDIIKRPVAMRSNLHDAVFRPETLDVWFADAGRTTPACDEPYARVNLKQLLEFYKMTMEADATKNSSQH